MSLLVPAHREEFHQSGLSDETIGLAGFYSAPAVALGELLGYGVPSSGWVIPYSENGDGAFVRVKLDKPDLQGKRYRSPKGRGNHLYMPPATLFDPSILDDVSVPLYIVEGEKKALRGCQEGLPTLALSGVWSWRERGPDQQSRPIADLDKVTWAGRTVYLVFDSDLATKPDVQAAEQALAQELARRGAEVLGYRLPPGPNGTKVGLDDYLLTHSIEAFCMLTPVLLAMPTRLEAYLELIGDFLTAADPERPAIFPELLPQGMIALLHGDPRSRKTLVGFELALSAATGTAPFGLRRFQPAESVSVIWVQEEDPRAPTRTRLRRLVQERCGAHMPDRLSVSVRRGVNLDDPGWVSHLIEDMRRLDVQLLVLDPARRLSVKTDEGPGKVKELTAVLRLIVTATGASIVIIHHDVKPQRGEEDGRRRGHRASGGDWFAMAECPIHIERLNEHESLVFPQDYKFSADPAPFTFRCELDGALICRLVGAESTTEEAEVAGVRGKLLDWLRANGPASKTTLKKAGFGWERLTTLLDGLMRSGLVDATPGRKKGSSVYFVVGSEPSSRSQDGSASGRNDAA